MLLKVMAFARNVGRDLHTVSQSDSSDLAKGRIGLLRGLRPDLDANTALLRRPRTSPSPFFQRVEEVPESRRLIFLIFRLPAFSNELVDRWQNHTSILTDEQTVRGTHLLSPMRAASEIIHAHV